jgi:hypothetical protein
MTYSGAAVGLAFTLLVGLAVKPLLRCMRNSFRMPPISRDPKIERWWKLLYEHPDPSGDWVGWVERIYFFFAIGFGSWEAIGVWLVFKLGSKWEAWNQMGYVPDDPNGYAGTPASSSTHPVTPLKWARARRLWAAMGYGTFVVGTAANLFVAAIGVLLAHNIIEIGSWMGTTAIQWK